LAQEKPPKRRGTHYLDSKVNALLGIDSLILGPYKRHLDLIDVMARRNTPTMNVMSGWLRIFEKLQATEDRRIRGMLDATFLQSRTQADLAMKQLAFLPALESVQEQQAKYLRSIVASAKTLVPQYHNELLRVTESLGTSTYFMNNLLQGCVGSPHLGGIQELAARLSSVGIAHAAFIYDTTKVLASATNVALQGALFRSIDVSGSQIVAASDMLRKIGVPTDLSDSMPSPCDLNLPWVQRKELLEIADADTDTEAPSTSIAIDICTAINTVLWCDDACKSVHSLNLLRFSNRSMCAVNELSFIVVIDGESLGDFVDHLFFLFYEGAGADNLRYLKAGGGFLEPDDCGFLWRLKHLRNNWLRHDIEHGQNGNIEKKRRDLQADLEFYGLRHKPVNEDEFRRLQTAIVDDMTSFVQKLQAAIKAR